MKKIRHRRFILFAVLLGPSTSAQAQYMGAFGVPFNNPVSATLSSSLWSNWVVYETQRKQAGNGVAGPASTATASAATPRATKADDPSLRFRSTGTHPLTNTLAGQITQDPPQKQQVATLIEAIFQEYDKQAVKLGKPNDLGLALSFFLMQNAAVFYGLPDPPDAQFLTLRETLAGLIAQNGAMKNLNDQQKQGLYEILVAYTGLAYAGYQDALKKGDQETTKAYRRLAGLNLKSITHLEPERLTFTPQGLTIKPQ